MRGAGPHLPLLWVVGLLVLLNVPPTQVAAEDQSFAYCFNTCSGSSQCRTSSPDDGICVCNTAKTGKDCSEDAPGISQLDTSTSTAYKSVANLVLDVSSSSAYLSARDVTTNEDRVLQFESASSGWKFSDSQAGVLAADTGWNGTFDHPHADYDATTSEGYFDVFRKVRLDSVATATAVYVPVNMWQLGSTTFKYKIYKFPITSGVISTTTSASYEKVGHYLDAFAVNEATSALAIKSSPDVTGTSSGVMTLLSGDLTELDADNAIDAIAGDPNYYRMEDACYVATDYFVFGGARVAGVAGTSVAGDGTFDGVYKPVLLRVGALSANFVGTSTDVKLEAFPSLSSSCENTGGAAINEGQYTTFATVISHNGIVYAGTRGRRAKATARNACLVSITASTMDTASMSTIVLDGAAGERDVLAGTVDSSGGFLYFSTSEGTVSRIVKVEISTFSKVGSFQMTTQVTGLSNLAARNSVLSASNATTGTTVALATTAEVTSLSPSYGPVTGGTTITLTGRGFWETPLATLGSAFTATIACRIGDPSVGTFTTSAATYVSSTQILCAAPAASAAGASASGMADVQLSFFGYPENTATAVWSTWSVYFRYYKVPVVYSISPKSVEDSGLSSTDGGTTTSPVLLTLTGGPFFDSGTIKCRLMDNSTSTLTETDAALVAGSSGTQISCYPCATSVVGTVTTCASPGIRTGPNPWTMVMVSLNGIDYHNASDSLNVFGEPAGVKVIDGGQHFSYAAAATTTVDTLTLMIVDTNGWLSPNYNNFVQVTGKSVSSGAAVSLFVTGTTGANLQTNQGYATFSLYFQTAPTVGDYVVTFSALDSAGTNVLATTDNITVTVTSGAASALTAIPRTLTVTASRDVLLGDVLVQMSDTAGNLVGAADTATRNVTVTSDRTSANGATLTGTLSVNTTLGEATFTLGLTSPALGASTSPAASSGSYTLTFATAGLTSVTVRVVVVEAAPTYLRISGSTLRTKVAQTNTYFDDITVRAYDEGHNAVASTDSQTRTITLSEPTGVLDLRGVTSFSMTSGAVTIRSLFAQAALSIYAYEPRVGSYSINIAADGLTSAVLTLNVTLNTYGEKMAVVSSSTAALPSTAALSFPDVSVSILDAGRNALGDADQARTSTTGAQRTIYALSDSLRRTGFGTLTVGGVDLNILASANTFIPATGNTPAIATGLANFTGTSAIVASNPAAGAHIVSFADQDGVLEVATVNVTVAVGPATALSVIGSPATTYSASYGAWTADEAAWYASEQVVPLETFVVQSVDAGGNVVTTSAPFTITTITVISTTLGALEATPLPTAAPAAAPTDGSTAPPPSPPPPPPPTGFLIESNTTYPTETLSTWTHTGGTVVVTQFRNVTTMLVTNATHTTAQNVSTVYNVTETYSEDHTITPSIDFPLQGTAYPYTTGLNEVGTYRPILILDPITSNSSAALGRAMVSGGSSWADLALYRPPAGTYTLTFSAVDPGIAPATVTLTVNLGVATQLGVLAPCGGSQVFAPGVCTQSVFGSAQRTSLNQMQISLLDGAANPVFGADYSCLDLLAEVPGDRNNPCPRTVSVRVVAGSATLTGTQTRTMVAGRVTFGDLAMIEPSTGSNSLLFESAGVNPVRFDLTVIPGAGYSLQVVPADGVPAPATSKDTYPSALETAISSPAYPLAVRVLDGGRNPIEVAQGSEYLVYVSCDTAEVLVDGTPGINFTLTTQGVAYFADLKLLSPPAQSHVLKFESSPATFGTEYEITVVVGPPVALAVTDFSAGDCFNEFQQPKTCSYKAVTHTALGSLEVSVRDAGGNDVGANNVAARRITAFVQGPTGWANLQYENLDPDIGPGEHDEEKTIMLPKTGSATFELLVLLNPPIGRYNITLTSPGMTLTVVEFDVTVGDAYTLSVPEVWPGLGGTDIQVRHEYESERLLLLETIPVIVLDGGFNFVGENDVNAEGQNFFRTVELSVNKGTLTAGTRKTSAGQVFYSDVRLTAPTAGLYEITFTAPGLEVAVLEVTVLIGYPSQLSVVNVGTRLSTEYESDELVTVNEVQVQLLDAGGSWVGNRWDEGRNVTVYLESTVNLDHGGSVYRDDYASPTNGLNETLLIVPQGGDMQVQGGRVAWCDPTLVTMPGYCRDGAFPIQFELPFHGRYTLVFMSDCPVSACPSRPGTARYQVLDEARLVIDIVPGTPVRLQFTSAPPSVAEHTFDLRPVPALEALDVAGNLCVQRNTFLSATFLPAMKEVYGSVTAMVGGEGAFENLRFVGVRGQVYTLRFEAPGLDLVVEFFPFEVMSCAEVKPHSRPDGRGGCECVPGYTEDVYVTGFASDRLELPSTASFPDMYRQVVHNEGNWLDILQPYGVCVPCRNGFYKPDGGAHNCTACPANMDTSRKDGEPAPPWTTESGEVLEGSLAAFNQSACHCIVEQEAPFRSYFRNATESYKCEPCPEGASCNGLDHREIAAQPGRWRSSRESLVFWECPNPGSCLGGVESWCSSYNGSGADGVLCAECTDGWAHPTVNGRFPPQCSKCIPRAAAGLVVLIQWAASLFSAFVVLRVNFRRNSDAVMFFKTLLNHMQSVSVAKDIDLSWPDGVATYFSLTEKLSTVSLQSKEADCAFDMNHYNYTGYYVALPVLIFLGAVGYAVAMFVLERKRRSKEAYRLKHQAQEEAAARRRRGDEGGVGGYGGDEPDGDDEEDEEDEEGSDEEEGGGEKDKGMLRRALKSDKDRGSADAGTEGEATYVDQAVAVAVIGFFYCYTTILRYLMGLIRCTDLSDSHRDHPVGDSYLVADLHIQCGTPTHAAWLFALLVFLGTYAIGVPVVWAVVLYNSEPAEPATRFRLGFLYKGQSGDARFWEFYVLARKTVMVCAAVLVYDNPRLAGYVCLWVVQVSVILHLWCDPMESERQSRLELLSLIVLMVTYNVGILYAGDVPYHTRNFLGFVVYIINLSVYVVFAQALWAELREESKVAMVKRAKADFRIEDEIRKKKIGTELGRLPTRHLHPRAAAALKTSFADDTLRDEIAAAETSDLRMRHLALSVHLENMRNAWRKSKTKGKVMHKQMALEDLARQRRREQVPVERWRMRRAEESKAREAAARGQGRRPPKPPKGAAKGDKGDEAPRGALDIVDSDEEPEEVPRWKQRMADKEWRTKERLKYRLAERFGEDGGGDGDAGSARTSDTAGGDTSYRSRTSYSRTTGRGGTTTYDDDGTTSRSRGSEGSQSAYTRDDRRTDYGSEYTRNDDATSMARSDDEGYTERSGNSRSSRAARSMLSP